MYNNTHENMPPAHTHDTHTPATPDIHATSRLNEPLNDYNRYSIKFDLENEEEPVEPPPRLTVKQIVIYVTVGIVFVMLFYYLTLKFGRRLLDLIVIGLRALVKSNNVFSYLLLASIQFVFGWVLFMPGLSTFNVLQAFLMQSFWKSLLISFIGSYLSSVISFLIIKTYFRHQIIEKFKRKIIFRILYIEVKKRPWQMGLLFNLLFIPASLKNYLMPLTSITCQQYAIVVFPVHMFYCAMFAFVGYSMKDINSMLHDDKPFSEKSTAQQVQSIVTWALLGLTIILMIGFGIIAKKKYAEIEEEHRVQVDKAKETHRELEHLHGNHQEA